jgi:PAS domain S-box-containing protein
VSKPSTSQAKKLRVLHLEDNPDDQVLVREMLEREGLGLNIDYAKSRPEFESALRGNHYDLIISDFTLPSYDGQAALVQARRLQPDVAFIFFSGTIGEDTAVESLKIGATDYILKHRPNRLVSAVRRAIEEVQERGRREAAEVALRRSEERFRIVARATHDVIWDWNIKSNVVWRNESFGIVFGHTFGPESPFSVFEDLLHPEDKHRVLFSLSAMMAGGGRIWACEYRLRRSNGEYACVYDRGHVVSDSKGRPERMIGVLIDMSERKQAEDIIREQAALLQKALEAIVVCDLENRVTFWNPSAERIYGWTVADAIGKSITQLWFNEIPALFDEACQSVLQRGEWLGELRQVNREGRPVSTQSSWTLIRDEAGRPKSKLIISTDITAKRQLEEQLLRAQRLESLGVLVGGIAHDLNNALAPVLMGASILAELPLPEGAREILKTIATSAQRGADMVTQVLTFARGDEGARLPVRVNQLVKEMRKIIKDTFPSSIRCEVNTPGDSWSVAGDSTQLHQVLMNLCINARDAMEDGGTLKLATRNVTWSEAEAGVHSGARTGRYLCVTVTDTGTGIPPEKLALIFQPFFTTKAPGKRTGLGLATVQSIVRDHGGFIEVNSKVGEGTEFKVFLPAIKETGPKKTAGPVLLPPGNGEGVLVVDDEVAVLAVMKATLENYDYRVFTAPSGSEAITLFGTKQDEIQLVITDLAMPLMDGVATIEGLRKIRPKIKIIAASGLEWKPEHGFDVEKIADAFLRKPFTVEKLLHTTRDVLTVSRERLGN